jgi:hypothetical protein
MGKKVNRDREKVLSKADIKANNILKAVKAYEAEDSDIVTSQCGAPLLSSIVLLLQFPIISKRETTCSICQIWLLNIRNLHQSKRLH